MVIEYFRKLKQKSRTFKNGVDFTDPYLQVYSFHALTESMKLATVSTILGWPVVSLLQRSFIRGIKRPKPIQFFRIVTLGSLLYTSGMAYYIEADKGFDYGILAFRAQNNKKKLEYENWGWGTGLAFGLVGGFVPGLSLGRLAVLGFMSGYGFVYGSDLLIERGWINKNVVKDLKKNISPLNYLNKFSVSGGYDKGFDDDED